MTTTTNTTNQLLTDARRAYADWKSSRFIMNRALRLGRGASSSRYLPEVTAVLQAENRWKQAMDRLYTVTP